MKKLLVGTVLFLAVAALPVVAGDDDMEGWFVGVEATSLRPSGGIANYAILDPNDANNAREGAIQSIEIDNEIAPRVFFGYGDGNGGMWSVSWWNFDDDNAESIDGTSPTSIWATLFDADWGVDEFNGTADAALAVDATVIDLTYSRSLVSNDKFSARWHMGLRSAEVERLLGVAYDDGTVYATALGTEAEGIGFTGGITGTYMLSDRWWLNGGSSYSMLMGDFDSATASLAGATVLSDITGEKEGGFSMLEGRFSVAFKASDWMYLWLGYEYQQWNNVLESNVFPDDVAEAFLAETVSDMTFDGYTFGAGFKF